MPIRFNLARALWVDMTLANLNIPKTGKARAVRFSPLDAICRVFDCQSGGVLERIEGQCDLD